MKSEFRNEILTCFGGAFLIMFMIGIYFVYLPWNMERLKISETQLGISICAFGFANLFANQLAARVIIPKIGTSNTIILGTIIFSYLPMIIASVPNYFYFTLFFIPIGIGAGFIFPVLNSQMAIIEQKTKKILIPFTQACFSAGSLFGALGAAFFMKLIPDPRITFFIVGTIYLIYGVCFYFFGLKKKYEGDEKIEKFKLPENNILIYGFLLMMNFATLGIIIDWSPVWLTKDLGAPLFLGGLIIICFNGGEIFARVSASKLINKFGEIVIGSYFSIISCTILFLSILSSNLYLILFGVVIFGFGTANFVAVVLRQAISETKESISLTVSNLLTLGFAGFIFGPAIVGYLAELINLTFNMYLLSTIWAFNGLALFYLINKNKLNKPKS
ncbi:MFS transporter [Pelagibacteraceae bacterium]|nr:MFS transporter [Pelagibacteraceae bacterium]